MAARLKVVHYGSSTPCRPNLIRPDLGLLEHYRIVGSFGEIPEAPFPHHGQENSDHVLLGIRMKGRCCSAATG